MPEQQSMSAGKNCRPFQSTSYRPRDALAVGLARPVSKAGAYLRREVPFPRIVAWCGIAGAVLLQAGLLGLVGQLVLMLDAGILPSVTASALALTAGSGLTAGAVVMRRSRALYGSELTRSEGA